MVNIFEAKARLSEYLDRMARGERVVICRRNQPVAELRPVAVARTGPRPIGGAKGQLAVPSAFFDPLPNDLLDAFGGGAPLYPPLDMASTRPLSVARETPAGAPRPRGGADARKRPKRTRRS